MVIYGIQYPSHDIRISSVVYMHPFRHRKSPEYRTAPRNAENLRGIGDMQVECRSMRGVVILINAEE